MYSVNLCNVHCMPCNLSPRVFDTVQEYPLKTMKIGKLRMQCFKYLIRFKGVRTSLEYYICSGNSRTKWDCSSSYGNCRTQWDCSSSSIGVLPSLKHSVLFETLRTTHCFIVLKLLKYVQSLCDWLVQREI